MPSTFETIREIHRLNIRLSRIDMDLQLLDCTPMKLVEIKREQNEQIARRDRLHAFLQGEDQLKEKH